jgi:quinoprotein glucose dehydrogenase
VTQRIVVLIIAVMTMAAVSRLYRAGKFLSRCKHRRRSRQIARALIALKLGCLTAVAQVALPAAAWEQWGGDRGGTRFSPLRQITPANVNRLVRAWEFRTGDLARRDPKDMAWTKFEGTPLFVESSLILCTPFNEVIAINPSTGVQKWRFDPKIAIERPANRHNCRGVTYWVDEQAPAGAACRSRIFMGTNDMRVIALDATTGAACSRFGAGGEVKIDAGMPLEWPGEMSITSPPVVARGIVVVGSSIADNVRVKAPRGTVWALDARTGQVRWTWDPLVHDGIDAGHANVWAPMSVDEEMGLVFLPTSSPSPDFWGGKRPGNNEHAGSVVALRADTGELVWAFQTVHHDLWDYDLPAQPTVAQIDTEAGGRAVVIQPTKQGFLFVLDRGTGQPIWPVEERPVPQGGADGEQLSPTQPFPTHVPPLVPQRISADDAFGLFNQACHDKLARARNDGLYTPPSTQGTLVFPFTGGGVNWGGAAFDPVNQILYANTSRAVHVVTLIPAAEARAFRRAAGEDFGPQRGAPFALTRSVARSPLGTLCNAPPWGVLVAVDLNAGKILWQSTVGTTEDQAPLGIAFQWGTPLVNGVLVTGGGLVFTGAMDAYLRAFDAKSGAELWQGRLPVPAIANPMTYMWDAEQYVVIAAGGHSEAGTSIGDSVVAFRLARAGEAPSLWSRTIDRPGGRFYYSVVASMTTTFLLFLGWTLLRRQAR